MTGLRRALVALAAALALADASIVALALPPMLVEFGTTITGVAAVVGVYALVLALALLPLARVEPARAGVWGLGLFALASLGCAVSGSLDLLLGFRALQALGGAAALLAAFHLLDAGAARDGRRLWLAAALVGTAAGPALGGALTEAFDWRAIFVVQAPLAAAAAFACRVPPVELAPPEPAALWSRHAHTAHSVEPRRTAPSRFPLADGAALAFTAAAFTAVLFLLVLELVAGFAVSPLRAALGVTVLPVAALAAAALPGPARPKALAGALLIAGGAGALAFLPAPGIAWTIVPQALAGAGIGLALPAFEGRLLPARTVHEAAQNLFARHVGIVLVLAILAPVATAQLGTTTERAVLEGTALVLDAQIEPLQKLELAPALLDDVDVDRPRAALQDAVERRRADFVADVAIYDRLAARLDDVVVVAVQDAFELAYLIAAGLALVASLLLAGAWRRPAVLAAAAVSAAAVLVYAVERSNQAPPPVPIADPCRERALPDSGGLTGAIQTEALRVLDRGACRFGTSREEFALALFDPDRAAAYEREHGVNPRDVSGLLSLIRP